MTDFLDAWRMRGGCVRKLHARRILLFIFFWMRDGCDWMRGGCVADALRMRLDAWRMRDGCVANAPGCVVDAWRMRCGCVANAPGCVEDA